MSAWCAGLVNIDNEDRCVLRGSQHDVLAPCERPRGHAVVFGAFLAVVVAAVRRFETAINTGVHDCAPTVFKKGVLIGDTRRSVV